MPSAVDVITFVGVPLAVLGVLPTIYTCIRSLLTLRSVRRTLEANGISAITRSSLLSGIVEIELPRKSITPLDRWDPAYFELAKSQSCLQGGSWTALNWKELVIGMKAYRLQYHDELRQPQAEVNFEQLVAFLLDLGAIPSPTGFSDLRTSGLWTPSGTKLLLSPTTSEAVLVTSTPDDSDGILSLAVKWSPQWSRRSGDALPPYWVRIVPSDECVNIEKALRPRRNEENGEVEGEKGTFYSPMRLRIGHTGVEDTQREDDPKQRQSILHLQTWTTDANINLWFACAATALGAPRGGLWSYQIPEEVIHLARRDSIPGGVMVLLGLMADDEVPTWRTPYDHESEELEARLRARNQQLEILNEMKLPPAEQSNARMARMRRQMEEFQQNSQRRAIEERKHQEQEMVEAFNSHRLGIRVVAEASRKWLVQKDIIFEGLTIPGVVEQILFCMIKREDIANRVSGMLDRWRNWTENGGMTNQHFQMVRDETTVFAFASFILCVIMDASKDPAGNVVSDLQDCLRIWKVVRLG